MLIRAALAWGPAVLWAGVLFLLSSTPDLPGVSWIDRIPAGDKLVHFAIYAVLGTALAWGHRLDHRVPHAALVLVAALYGASDEWHQSFVPGRHASAVDWLADLGGAAVGYWTGSMFWRRSDDHTRTGDPSP